MSPWGSDVVERPLHEAVERGDGCRQDAEENQKPKVGRTGRGPGDEGRGANAPETQIAREPRIRSTEK